MSFAQHLLTLVKGEDPYTKEFVSDSLTRRSQQEEGLCIDHLLLAAEVPNASTLYPPRSLEDTQKLIADIENQTTNKLVQARILLYIFLDFSNGKYEDDQGSATAAQYYASQLWMSDSEQGLVRGVWCLDAGRTEEALQFLGRDWSEDVTPSLGPAIVNAIFHQKVELVAAYLACQGYPLQHQRELVNSLVVNGKFSEAIDIARHSDDTRNLLHTIAIAGVNSKPYALELAQLACKNEEWLIIKEKLDEIAENPGSSEQAKTLVHNIVLTRALHLGDNDTLKELRGIGKADLFIKNAQVAN